MKFNYDKLRHIKIYDFSLVLLRPLHRRAIVAMNILLHISAREQGFSIVSDEWKEKERLEIRKQFNLHVIESHKHLFQLIADFRLTPIHHRLKAFLSAIESIVVWIIGPITMSFLCHPKRAIDLFPARRARMQRQLIRPLRDVHSKW